MHGKFALVSKTCWTGYGKLSTLLEARRAACAVHSAKRHSKALGHGVLLQCAWRSAEAPCSSCSAGASPWGFLHRGARHDKVSICQLTRPTTVAAVLVLLHSQTVQSSCIALAPLSLQSVHLSVAWPSASMSPYMPAMPLCMWIEADQRHFQ